jgi:hypothetical protein
MIKKKQIVRWYVLGHIKNDVKKYAERLGFSESEFISFLYQFWINESFNPYKDSIAVDKLIQRKLETRK